ncbi:MAG: FkbM family methyltransferase [Candidatus Paceibacterota bacterium]|jgi:FkbM family methyltransferase
MTESSKQEMIQTIVKREQLRPLGRLSRLLKDPVRATPFYALALLGHIKPFPVSFRTLWDTTMRCYLPEGNTFYYYGFCEANLTNFFLRFAREGMTFIDVGAHIGFYTALFSELAGSEGKVHGFEPTPWTYRLLSENTAGLSNVTLNNNAVSEKAESLSFSDYGAGYGAFNSAHPDGAPEMSRRPSMTTVTGISLDAYCADRGVRPDIVKIDAEGFEASVLRGMGKMLAAGAGPRPIITLEVAGDRAWAENRAEAFATLSAAGYVAHEISVDGFLSEHATRESYTYDNLVFVPRERLTEISPFLHSLKNR